MPDRPPGSPVSRTGQPSRETAAAEAPGSHPSPATRIRLRASGARACWSRPASARTPGRPCRARGHRRSERGHVGVRPSHPRRARRAANAADLGSGWRAARGADVRRRPARPVRIADGRGRYRRRLPSLRAGERPRANAGTVGRPGGSWRHGDCRSREPRPWPGARSNAGSSCRRASHEQVTLGRRARNGWTAQYAASRCPINGHSTTIHVESGISAAVFVPLLPKGGSVAPGNVFDQFALHLRPRGAGASLGTPRCAAAAGRAYLIR